MPSSKQLRASEYVFCVLQSMLGLQTTPCRVVLRGFACLQVPRTATATGAFKACRVGAGLRLGTLRDLHYKSTAVNLTAWMSERRRCLGLRGFLDWRRVRMLSRLRRLR